MEILFQRKAFHTEKSGKSSGNSIQKTAPFDPNYNAVNTNEIRGLYHLWIKLKLCVNLCNVLFDNQKRFFYFCIVMTNVYITNPLI